MTKNNSVVDGRISFLNVGAKLLLRDTMDQFVRSLGDYKTYYAANMGAALQVFERAPIQVMITEAELEDASVYRLIQTLGGVSSIMMDDLYVILAIEEKSDKYLALAREIEAHSILVKPFNATDLKDQVEKFKVWKARPKEPWRNFVREAQAAVQQKRYREAEDAYKKAVDSDPQNPMPLLKAGEYYLKKPDYPIAEGLFKKALALKPDFVQATAGLAQVYLNQHDLDKANEFLTQAYHSSPLNPDRIVEMVRLHLERCVESCRESLKLDASNATARLLLGKLLALHRDYVGAVRELERAVPFLKDTPKAEAQTYLALARKIGSLAK